MKIPNFMFKDWETLCVAYAICKVVHDKKHWYFSDSLDLLFLNKKQFVNIINT